MSLPASLYEFFVGVMVVISSYFAGRLILARIYHRRIHVEVNVAELVMGVAMVGMFRPDLNVLPNTLWELVFAGFALWFVVATARFVTRHGLVGGDAVVQYHRVHYPLHVVMSLSMLYMLFATPVTSTPGRMVMVAPSGTAADFVFLPLLFT